MTAREELSSQGIFSDSKLKEKLEEWGATSEIEELEKINWEW